MLQCNVGWSVDWIPVPLIPTVLLRPFSASRGPCCSFHRRQPLAGQAGIALSLFLLSRLSPAPCILCCTVCSSAAFGCRGRGLACLPSFFLTGFELVLFDPFSAVERSCWSAPQLCRLDSTSNPYIHESSVIIDTTASLWAKWRLGYGRREGDPRNQFNQTLQTFLQVYNWL